MLRRELPKVGSEADPATEKQLWLNQLVTLFWPTPLQVRLGRGESGVGVGEIRTQNGEGIAGLIGGDIGYFPSTHNCVHDASCR